MTAELMKTNAQDAAGSSCGQQTMQGACVSNRAVQDRGRPLNQSHFRPMAEVFFLPSANTRKRASASREVFALENKSRAPAVPLRPVKSYAK